MTAPCDAPACAVCSPYCPDCGADLDVLVIAIEAGRVRCPRCGQEDNRPHPEMIAMRHQPVRAISGRSIPEWKGHPRQLNAKFHHRWRSTMRYLDPAVSAALWLAQEVYREL
jgi:hypothetical protein